MLLKKEYTFECDDKICDAIIELNLKGYSSDFSCSGHPGFETLPYISFTRVASLYIETHPNNWMIDNKLGNVVIRRYFTDEEFLIFTDDQLIDLAMQELSNWIDTLPEVCDPYGSLKMEKIEN